MAVNWALGLQQGPNPGERFAEAFHQGQETARQNKARAAMAALAKDPNNTGALSALAEADPETALTYQTKIKEAHLKELDAHRDQIKIGAQIIRSFGVKDEQTYQAAKAFAVQNGVDISQLPANFDASYVQNVVHLADALSPERSSEVVVTPQPGAPAYIYDKGTGATKQIVFPEGQAPKPLTDDDIARMEGGQSPSGSGGFPGPY